MTSNNKKISLKNKIGAMLMFGFRGTKHSDDSVQKIIKDIILYKMKSINNISQPNS